MHASPCKALLIRSIEFLSHNRFCMIIDINLKPAAFCIALLPNFAINMNNNPKLTQHQTTQYYHCSFILDMKNKLIF